jgi:hypothetical protein
MVRLHDGGARKFSWRIDRRRRRSSCCVVSGSSGSATNRRRTSSDKLADRRRADLEKYSFQRVVEYYSRLLRSFDEVPGDENIKGRADWSRRRNPPSWRFTTADHDPPYELNIKQVAHHCSKDTKSPAPAATHAMPAARAIHRPTGVSFSKSTSSAKSAIQSTFITPPTNKSAIKTQQQPTQ